MAKKTEKKLAIPDENTNDDQVSKGELVGVEEHKANFADEKLTKVIDSYLAALDDYRSAFALAVPFVAREKQKDLDKLKKKIDSFATKNIDGDVHLVAKGPHAASTLQETINDTNRLVESKTVQSLIKSLFIGLFSEYDGFIGRLLKAIYSENENLLKGISREITLTELMNFKDIDSVKLDMLDKEIESFRRESYSTQFAELEKKFNLTTLRNFPEWGDFIEISQRRNLFTHNGGHVSQQYLTVCRNEKSNLEDDIKVGKELEITIEYYFKAIYILSKVGFMLAHTLWAKVSPNKIQLAADAMNNSIYLMLKRKRWRTASEFGLFGLSVPQLKTLDDITKKIRIVNTAIALKKIEKARAIELIDREDWSACLREFKLATAVLKEQYIEAGKLMKLIGKQGELIDQLSYHQWPLFEEFRDTNEFQEAYESIYEISFIEKTSVDAMKRSKEIDQDESKNDQATSSVKKRVRNVVPKKKVKVDKKK